jgi:hypothetical protein
MKSAAYRSFGLVAVITTFPKGANITIDPMVNNTYTVYENFGYVWMHTKGTDILVNTSTGETAERAPGCNLIDNPLPLGEWRATIPEDIEVVCYSPANNSDKVPLRALLEPVVIPAGGNKQMPQMTQFFLAAGDIQIGEKLISGPKPVRMKTGDVIVTAVTDVYGFIVK